MADLDRLDIAAGIDTTGLDAGLTQELRLLDRFAASLSSASQNFPPIEITATSTKAEQTLAETRAKFERVIAETRDLAKFPDLSTGDARREIGQLVGEFTGLDAAIKRIEPSGALGGVAAEAQRAASAIDAILAKEQQASGVVPPSAVVAPLGATQLAPPDLTPLTSTLDRATATVRADEAEIRATLAQPTQIAAPDTSLLTVGLDRTVQRVGTAGAEIRDGLTRGVGTLPALDAAGFERSVTQVRQIAEAAGPSIQQALNRTALSIPGLSQSLAPDLERVEQFARSAGEAIARVHGLDTSQVTAGLTAGITQSIVQMGRLGATTEQIVGVIRQLPEALGRIVLAPLDTSPLTEAFASAVRVTTAGTGEIQQALTQGIGSIPAPDLTPLRAGMEGAVLAVRGSTEQIHQLLAEPFVGEAQIRQAVPAIASADTSGQAARLAAAVEAEAATASAAAAALDGLTAAQARQAIGALQSGAAATEAARQIAQQGQAAQVAAEQTIQAQRLASASVAAAVPPSQPPRTPPPSGLREVIGQQEQLAATAEQAAVAERKLGEAMAAASNRGSSLASGFAVAAAQARTGNLALEESAVRGAAAFEGHTRATGRAVNAITALAASSIGAAGPVSRLAETALLFSGGEVAVVAVASGVLALAVAYNYLTTAERETRQENEKLVALLLQESASAVPAAERAARGLTAAIEVQTNAQKDLDRIKSIRVAARLAGVLPTYGVVPTLLDETFGSEAQRQAEKGLTDAGRAVEQAQRNKTQAVKDFQSINVAVLTESITLHAADAEHIARAQALVAELRRQEEAGNLPPAEHNRLLRERQVLEAALRDEALQAAQKAGTQQGISDDLALEQQGIAARQDALKAAFDQELINRRQFYAARRELAVNAERAEVAALQQRLSETTSKPGQTPAAQVALDTEAEHLRAQIKLREAILRLQLSQLANEKALADLAEQRITPAATLVPTIDLSQQPLARGADPLTSGEIEAHLRAVAAATDDEKLSKELERARLAAEALDPLLVGIGLSLHDIGNANISVPAEKFVDTFAKAAEIAGGIRSIGQESGLFKPGSQADKVLGGAEDISGGVSKILKGDIIGGVVEGIKGVVGVIGGLFGKSQTEKDLEQAQRENTRALADATKAYQISQGKFQGAGGIAEQQRIVGSVLESPLGKQAFRDVDLGELEAAAKAAGTSLTEMRNIAHDYGITLVKDHHLVAGAADALTKALDLAAKAATTLPTDIPSQTITAENRDKLGLPSVTGVPHSDDPNVARLNRIREIELNNLVLGAAEEARIRALNLSTAEGRKAFLAFERELEVRAENKGFTAAELGNFPDPQALQGIIGEAADGLNAFTNATLNATRALSNVPDLQTLAEQEFRARSAFGTGQGPNDGAQLPPFPPVGDPRLHGTDITPQIPAPGISASRVSLDATRAADPIISELGKLGGGATLKDLLEALQPTGAKGASPQPAQALRAVQIFGPISFVFPDAKDPDATAKAIIARLQSIDLATNGREDG